MNTPNHPLGTPLLPNNSFFFGNRAALNRKVISVFKTFNVFPYCIEVLKCQTFQLNRNITEKLNLPPFCTSVLEPSFDLSVGHLERLGKRRPLCGRQIFLFVKTFLQFCYLQASERCPRLLPLRRCSVLIRVSNSPRNGESGCERQQATDCIIDSFT